MTDFVHLHTHSDFSLLDGAASIPALIAKAKEYDMKHLALTDHGNMFGALKFYKECQKEGINPLIGCEMYLAPESRFKKTGADNSARYYHLLLLARNEMGYRNLLKLSSQGYTEGFYYKPRIDRELLEQHNDGLTCLSACLAGEIPREILQERPEQAVQTAEYYAALFGKDHFFLELQDHGIAEQRTVNKALIEIAHQTGIPLVATNDIHYPDRTDAIAQDVLICIGTNKKLSDGKRLKFTHPEFYFKSGAQMFELFKEIPQALKNSLAIAEMCQLKIPLTGPILPDYKVPDSYSIESYLTHLAQEGLKKRYNELTPAITQRLSYELKTICAMGFAGYFLIVWDFIHYSKQNNIPVGPGRGSGAGSLVAYALEITDIDPLEYGLLFERFLNPDRVSMPDFDIDFCIERRQDVIDYVTNKYGKEKVGQIITFGTLKAKAAIRDVARVLDFPYAEADGIAKLIPTGPKVGLADALAAEPKLSELGKQSEKHRDLIDISKKLEGLSRHASTHAAGVVIGKEDLTHYVPLYKDPKTAVISTQFTMDYLEECGLVKMDFLGLKNLTIIDKTCRMIRKKNAAFDIKQIPKRDPLTFKLLSQGKSTCVFQFESQGMQNILKRAKPDKIEDLIALNALYRPGPMENIDQYIDSKSGKRKISYPLPQLEPILKETYGVIIYQEQVMEIAKTVAGFSLGQADILRRAMGKKKHDVMEEQKKLFVSGAVTNKYSRDQAAKLFDLLVPFAGYGFNKSHAAAYSIIAYQTAYLKANYPAEFMAAYLTSEINDTDKLSAYIAESRDMGLTILPPDINLAEKDFTVVEGKIIYGLNGIKNVGGTAVKALISEREQNGKFTCVGDFLERVDLKVVNRKVIEALILSGVLDHFGENRATLFQNMDKMIEFANQNKERKAYGQISLFDSPQFAELTQLKLEIVEEWPMSELLRLEKQNLGFYFTGHPLDKYREVIRSFTTLDLKKLDTAFFDRNYSLIGSLKEIKTILTKKGRKMAFATLEDFNGSLELIIFSDLYDKITELLVEDNIVAVWGKLDKSRGDSIKIIAENISRADNLEQKEANAVHVRLTEEIANEDSLYNLREYILNRSGKYSLFLHVFSAGAQGKEKVIRAPNFSISAEDDFLAKIRSNPLVVDVWKE